MQGACAQAYAQSRSVYAHSMKAAERRSRILDLLGAGQGLMVSQMSRTLGVSSATVRRDLNLLDQQGLLRRTHGGARTETMPSEVPVTYRNVRKIGQKLRIAQAATRYIHEDVRVVGLSAGTTTFEVSRLMNTMAGLTIVTTALNVALHLVTNPHLRVIVVGGEARPMSLELVGPIADDVIGGLHVDVTFLGVDAIDVDRGCLAHDALGAATNAALVRQSRRTVVVTDSSKVGSLAGNPVCALSDVDVVITDDGVDPHQIQLLRNQGLVVDVV